MEKEMFPVREKVAKYWAAFGKSSGEGAI